MGKKTKRAVVALAILLALAAAGATWLYLNLDRVVAGIIEDQGSAATETAVRVGGVSIALPDASARISNLDIANPEGFEGNAIELGGFSIRIDPSTLAADTIVLEEVMVSGARINLVQQGASNNLRALLANLATGGDEAESDSGAGRKLIIERFVLEGASASVSVPELDELREVSIATIELAGIGRASNGETGAQVARQVLEPIIERTLRSAAAQSVRDRANEKVDEVRDSLLEGQRNRLGGDDEKEGE